MTYAPAFAKINLALVVGGRRGYGKHEVATLLDRVAFHDLIGVERVDSDEIVVEGFEEDTLVRGALERLTSAASPRTGWRVRIEKRIPIRAGLGGGSSDAAATLRLANGLLAVPLPQAELRAIAAAIGADAPFFLAAGPQLASADGTELSPVDLPRDYSVLLAVPHDEEKESTAAVYRRFDERDGAHGFEQRRRGLLESLAGVRSATDLACLPRNDLASSPLSGALERLGAFRADVSGAGPAVYGLFERAEDALRAQDEIRETASTWLTQPVLGP